MIRLIIAAAAALFMSSAQAQECLSIEDFVLNAPEGIIVYGMVQFPGVATDGAVFFGDGQRIYIMATNEGCVITDKFAPLDVEQRPTQS